MALVVLDAGHGGSRLRLLGAVSFLFLLSAYPPGLIGSIKLLSCLPMTLHSLFHVLKHGNCSMFLQSSL